MKGCCGLLLGRTEQHPGTVAWILAALVYFIIPWELLHICSLSWPFLLPFCYHATDICLASDNKFILLYKSPSVLLLFVGLSAEGSLEVAMQQLIQDLLVFTLWNQEQLSTAFNNLSRFVEESAGPMISSSLCSCSVSWQDSERSSPGYIDYNIDEASSSNGRNIGGTSEQPLHYPSNALLNPGDVKLISDESLARLEDIIQRYQMTVGAGYEEALCKDLVDNAGTFSSFFYQLPTQWVLRTETFIDPFEFTLELTNKEVIRLKFNTEVLRLMCHQLCEQSQSYREIKIYYFTQFAKLPIKNLLDIALSLSEVNWSANHVRPMLLVYEAITDVLPFIRKFPSSEPEELYCKIEDNMRNAFRVFFSSVKNSITHVVKSEQNVPIEHYVPIHSVTCSLVHSIKVFFSHRNLVQCFLAPDDEADSFCNLLDDLIGFWIRELIICSGPACQEWRCIFLLNNFKHIEETNCQYELLNGHQVRVTDDYVKSWGTAKSCLNGKCLGRRSMVQFASIFDKTWDVQKDWKVPNFDLKNDLRVRIAEYIVPEYKRFFEELQGCSTFRFSCFHGAAALDIYTPDRLEKMIDGLFEG